MRALRRKIMVVVAVSTVAVGCWCWPGRCRLLAVLRRRRPQVTLGSGTSVRGPLWAR